MRRAREGGKDRVGGKKGEKTSSETFTSLSWERGTKAPPVNRLGGGHPKGARIAKLKYPPKEESFRLSKGGRRDVPSPTSRRKGERWGGRKRVCYPSLCEKRRSDSHHSRNRRGEEKKRSLCLSGEGPGGRSKGAVWRPDREKEVSPSRPFWQRRTAAFVYTREMDQGRAPNAATLAEAASSCTRTKGEKFPEKKNQEIEGHRVAPIRKKEVLRTRSSRRKDFVMRKGGEKIPASLTFTPEGRRKKRAEKDARPSWCH